MKVGNMRKLSFYGIDGDKIENVIEGYLIEGEIDKLNQFSSQLTSTLEVIKQQVIEAGGEIIYSAGDNILFYGLFQDDWCKELLNIYRNQTGCTASMGIGNTMAEFYLALKLAKSSGGGKIVHYRLIINEGKYLS